MFGFVVRRLALRRRAALEAEGLMAAHGDEAWSVVHARCRDRTLTEDERAFAYKVRRIIEKRLGIPPRIDTATRYLES